MKKTNTLLSRIDRFWFAPQTSKAFGLMRVLFGIVAFMAFIWQWDEVTRFYSDLGMLPRDLIPQFLRSEWRFSVLDYVGDPASVTLIYAVLLMSLVLTTLGVFTRPALILSTLLIFSFHERNPTILAGGDTVLRHIAFILVLSPCHRSFSLWSYKKRLTAWLTKRLDPVESLAVMPKWPYRLLLWQFAMIYMASLWTKLHGDMWRDGSAVEIVMHHEHFLRFPVSMVAPLFPLGMPTTYFVLASQAMWIVMLLVPVLVFVLPPLKKPLTIVPWKRIAILSSALVHLMIFLLMDVGIFSLILFAGYVGLMTEADMHALRRLFNGKKRKPIIVLYDGHCGLCLRSVFFLTTLDWLKRLKLIDFRDASARKKAAPDITLTKLDRALHIILPNKKTRMGFSAFRSLTWHLPVLWPLAAFLYIPGVKPIGDLIYGKIAAERKRCEHKDCGL